MPESLLCFYPHYKLYLKYHPLPLCCCPVQAQEFEEDHQANRESEDDDDGSFEGSYSTKSHSRKSNSSHHSIKKAWHRTKSTRADDSDEEPDRQPLANSFLQNRQKQRHDQHPTNKMSSMTTRNGNNNSKSQSRLSKKEKELADENAKLRGEIARQRKRVSLMATSSGPNKKKKGISKAMTDLVSKKTKLDIWKTNKFIKNNENLAAATKKLMKMHPPQEFGGLEGQELAEAEEDFVAAHKEMVCKSINGQVRTRILGT